VTVVRAEEINIAVSKRRKLLLMKSKRKEDERS
jgi:hypothetical protein